MTKIDGPVGEVSHVNFGTSPLVDNMGCSVALGKLVRRVFVVLRSVHHLRCADREDGREREGDDEEKFGTNCRAHGVEDVVLSERRQWP